MKDFQYVVPNATLEEVMELVHDHLANDKPIAALNCVVWYRARQEAQRHVDRAIRAFIEAVKNS